MKKLLMTLALLAALLVTFFWYYRPTIEWAK
jgi:hypothetical protein